MGSESISRASAPQYCAGKKWTLKKWTLTPILLRRFLVAGFLHHVTQFITKLFLRSENQ